MPAAEGWDQELSKNAKKAIFGLFFAVVLLAVGFWSLRVDRTDRIQHQFQGYVEGELVFVGPEFGGRLVQLHVKEGEQVKEGNPLFEIDSTIEQARLQEAKARLAEAQAQLEDLSSARMRSEEISVLEAREKTAEANYKLAQNEYQRTLRLFERNIVSQARFDSAKSALDRSAAELDIAKREINVAHLSARAPQINQARAAVKAALAAVSQAEIRLSKHEIKAPVTGQIDEIYFRKGEVVGAGQTVVALLPPGNIKARFFVPESDLFRIVLGSKVRIECDNCPPDLLGTIDFIANEAEFTPPVIFGPTERAKLVFRAEADLAGTGVTLAPGQPISIIAVPEADSGDT